jgi:uncharacterized protein YndB with AHSA1/START domain
MRLSTTTIEPLRKQRRVPLAPARTFELFTDSMATWWPLQTHSCGEEDAIDIRFEGRIGGRIVEITKDGTEYDWADVIAWDPPHRFVLAWHPNPEPVAATIIDVRFSALDGGGTQIDLVHSSWEELGDELGRATREGYDTGWDHVLGAFDRSHAPSGT